MYDISGHRSPKLILLGGVRKMKYYSEQLDKIFETEEQLLDAEAENQMKLEAQKAEKEKRATAAKEVEELFNKANDAYKLANDKLEEFVKTYGSYHMTLRDSNLPRHASLFDFLFDSYLL